MSWGTRLVLTGGRGRGVIRKRTVSTGFMGAAGALMSWVPWVTSPARVRSPNFGCEGVGGFSLVLIPGRALRRVPGLSSSTDLFLSAGGGDFDLLFNLVSSCTGPRLPPACCALGTASAWGTTSPRSLREMACAGGNANVISFCSTSGLLDLSLRRRNGKNPFLVVGSGGITSTGGHGTSSKRLGFNTSSESAALAAAFRGRNTIHFSSLPPRRRVRSSGSRLLANDICLDRLRIRLGSREPVSRWCAASNCRRAMA